MHLLGSMAQELLFGTELWAYALTSSLWAMLPPHGSEQAAHPATEHEALLYESDPDKVPSMQVRC